MNKITMFTAVILALFVAGCGAAQSAEDAQEDVLQIENNYAPQDGDEALNQDGASVDSARWDEARQSLIFTGNLPTPCSQLRATINQNGNRVYFNLYSVSEPEVICAQMLEPFEASFKIASFDPLSFRIFANGQEMPL